MTAGYRGLQGVQTGVLLVRLCSASLQTGAELTHPAVRLTAGKQASGF